MRNLTRGEMVFRLIFGIGVIVGTIVPLPWGNYLNWVLAGVMIVTGLMLYCPICHIVDRS